LIVVTAVSRNAAYGIGFTDAVCLLFIYLVPALSHALSVPLYLLDPMRLAVLGALLVTGNWKNSLILAITLPFFSALLGMHPVFPKCLLIAIELSVNVLLFIWLSRAFGRSRAASGLAVFVSILLSKGLYYGLKALVLSAGLLQMDLVSTAPMIQLAVALLISLGFAIWWKK